MDYNQAKEYILDIPKFTSKNTREHTKKLLDYLKNPQNAFYVIHVAGSNGKGSVCNFINNALICGNVHTGLFTSPHLIEMTERFQIDGQPCKKKLFLEAFLLVKEAVTKLMEQGEPHPTFFEFIFAIGMVIFKMERVEYAVLETGMGGRLDATNIIERPQLTIITSISLEHTNILGDTIEEIAAEKAGIIKNKVLVIYDGRNQKAAELIQKTADDKEAPAIMMDESKIKILLIHEKGIDFCYQTRYDNKKISIPFCAPYQTRNAVLAWEAMKYLQEEINITDEQILKGFQSAIWPGRMEEIMPYVFLDGAHNTEGIQEFLIAAKMLSRIPPILIFGIGEEKKIKEAVDLLTDANYFKEIILTTFTGQKGVSADTLKGMFELKYPIYFENEMEKSTKITSFSQGKDALHYGLSKRMTDQHVFCIGSLYLVGEFKNIIENEVNL